MSQEQSLNKNCLQEELILRTREWKIFREIQSRVMHRVADNKTWQAASQHDRVVEIEKMWDGQKTMARGIGNVKTVVESHVMVLAKSSNPNVKSPSAFNYHISVNGLENAVLSFVVMKKKVLGQPLNYLLKA